jgi:hypothetical protein
MPLPFALIILCRYSVEAQPRTVTSALTPRRTMATMTGVAGTSPSVLPLASVYPADGATGSVSGGWMPMIAPMKGLPGTILTIVGPRGITNMTQWIVACYYIAA